MLSPRSHSRASAAPPYGLVPLAAAPWDHRAGKRIDAELRDELVPGGTASAYVRVWDTAVGELVTTALVITVYDVMDMFTADAGDFVYVEWKYGRWVVRQAQCADHEVETGNCEFGESVSVVIAGVTNGTCGTCSAFNATWALAATGSFWQATDGSICGGAALRLSKSGSTWTLRIGINGGATTVALYQTTAECVEGIGLTLDYVSSSGSVVCGGWPATLTVTGG